LQLSGGRSCLRFSSLTFPPSPLPLPRCGRGRGRVPPHLPPSPLPLPRCGRGRGRAALTFPPTPFLSHAVGEEGGGCPSLSPQPLPLPDEERKGGDEPSSGDSASFNDAAFTNPITPLPQRGRGARGEGGPHLPPGPLPFPDEESKGEMGLAVAILRLSTIPRSRTQSPLSRSAGEGLGVRAALTFPPAPFRSQTRRARGK